MPLRGVVPWGIEELVVQTDGKGHHRVDRINYEICILQELRERLRCNQLLCNSPIAQALSQERGFLVPVTV